MAELHTTSSANGKLWGERAGDWASIQEGQCRAVYQAVLTPSLVRQGTRYLDVGCGSGMASVMASQRGAAVSGIDASEELLTIARSRMPSADLRLGELQELPFDNGVFDVVTGFNSFQYAADPLAALRQAKRVANRGGTVVIMTWGEPAGMPAAQLVAALKPCLPPAHPGAPGPFALSDAAALRSFAASAALEPASMLDVDCPWVYPDLETAVRGLNSSGVAAKARQYAGDEAVTAAHRDALANFRQADGTYRVGATFRVLFAIA